ncbi:hypothetical protein EMN47_14210 [Prolixibacteraceae bacterium JC049]|nr:hypothetical protein [Prolixibacteraceae bacterium JC049]
MKLKCNILSCFMLVVSVIWLLTGAIPHAHHEHPDNAKNSDAQHHHAHTHKHGDETTSLHLALEWLTSLGEQHTHSAKAHSHHATKASVKEPTFEPFQWGLLIKQSNATLCNFTCSSFNYEEYITYYASNYFAVNALRGPPVC